LFNGNVFNVLIKQINLSASYDSGSGGQLPYQYSLRVTSVDNDEIVFDDNKSIISATNGINEAFNSFGLLYVGNYTGGGNLFQGNIDKINLWKHELDDESFIEHCKNFDSYKTNLISRFLTTASLKEFDTTDKKLEKVLQLYGRSFDETKKFIDALANMNSVRYNVKNDIPSQLLRNLSQTLGWGINMSPISETQLLDSVFNSAESNFSGVPIGQTPEELNYQYFRNLLLNSAFLFKSKGTRKSIEILMRLIGAPEFLVDFND
jgi:hypothetical protein